MSGEVNQRWDTTTLGVACQINPPKPKLAGLPDNTPVMFIPMAAVDDVTGTVAAAKQRTLGEVRSKSYRTFGTQDVIFAKITPCMENGKCAVVPDIPSRLGFGSTEFHVLRPRSGVNPRFIWHYVRQESFRRLAEDHMTGSVGQLRVPVSFLEDFPILLPPESIQNEIVRILDGATMSGMNASRHLVSVQRAIQRLRQAIFAAACSGHLTAEWREEHSDVEPADAMLERHRDETREKLGHRYKEPRLPDTTDLPEIPESWAWAALPELGELGRGKSKHRPRNDPRLYGGPYPFIQTGDVARSGGKITAHSQAYNEAGLAQSKFWPVRTVCITIAANIADSGLLTYPACFPDSVVGLIADESIAVPEYVELFIRTARRNLSAFAPATAQANINLAILAEVAVALPPVEEQREIVARAEAMYAVCAKVEAAIRSGTRRVERSSQAILARAFRGELIPTSASSASGEPMQARASE
jgi:type I restriction enzyme, S subunit